MKIFNYFFYKHFFKLIYYGFVLLLKKVIVFILKIFNIQISFERYPFINYRKYWLNVILFGFHGVSLILFNKYINKKTYIKNISQSLFEKKIFPENYHSLKYKNIIPISIIESALNIDDGYKIKYFSRCIKKYFINNNSSKILVLEDTFGFFHFYIELLPLILRISKSKEYNLMFNLGNEEYYHQILFYYNINFTFSNEYDLKIKNFTYYTNYKDAIYPCYNDSILLRNITKNISNNLVSKHHCIYISRVNNINGRRIFNESELYNHLLLNYNFKFVDPDTISFAEQVTLFSNAQIIIAAHGAALSHIISVPKDCLIIELNGDHDVRWHYAKMCSDFGINHNLVIGNFIDDLYFSVDVNLVDELVFNHFKLLDR